MKRPLFICVVGCIIITLLNNLITLSILHMFILTVCLSLAMLKLTKYFKWQGFFVMGILMVIYISRLVIVNEIKPIDQLGQQEYSLLIKDIVKIKTNGKYVCIVELDRGQKGKAYIHPSAKHPLHIGDQLRVKGEIKKPEPQRFPGGFDEAAYFRNKGWQFNLFVKSWQLEKHGTSPRDWFFRVRRKFVEAFDGMLPDDEAYIMKRMVLGGAYDEGKEIKALYQKGGLLHILAISGLHISLIGAGMFLLFKWLLGGKWGYIITLVGLSLYGVFTGLSPSTFRAILMFALLFLGQVIGRKTDSLTTLSFAAMILLLINPLGLFDVGFQLSFGAVTSLMLITPLATRLKGPKWIMSYLLASVAVFIGTWPIVAYYFYGLSLGGVLLNVIIVPLVPLLLLGGIIGGLLGLISQAAGQFFLGMSFYILQLIKAILTYMIKLPMFYQVIGRPPFLFILAYYILLIGLLYYLYKRSKVVLPFMGAVVVGCLVMMLLNKEATKQVTFLDVGQGDCTVIEVGSYKGIVDGGIDGENLTRYLQFKGVNYVEDIFISHSDQDHIGGIIPLLDGVKVGRIWLSPATIQEKPLLKKLKAKAKEKGIPLYPMTSGRVLESPDLTIRCLGPVQEIVYPDANENSLILEVNIGEVKYLLTGDMEEFAEKASWSLLSDIHVLKVPHHGSNSSSSDTFLEKVDAEIGIISSGVGNRYGHPHKEVVKRLEKYEIKQYNTATDGTIICSTKNQQLTVKKWLRE